MGRSYKYFKIKCNYAIFLNYFNGIFGSKKSLLIDGVLHGIY